MYTDISLPGPQGQKVKVSDYVGKNKLVMIDFWASWCGPCIGEMPYVVKTYEMFHDKGLEIVGVSLDKDKASWLQAVAQTGQKWPQMSDLKGWESEGAARYGIRSIPANVLINEQGEIVARDLRGDALLKEVESRLAAEAVAE
jgi:thiol-disulfide isomerase/thioredoxin